MKLSQLKSLIKESIKELIREGLLEDVIKECIQEMVVVEGSSNSMSGNYVSNNKLLEQNAKNTAARLVKNGNGAEADIYNEIFLDTAKTTLQKQLTNEPQAGPSSAMILPPSQQSISTEIDQLKSLGKMENWATMAFSKKTVVGN